MGRKKARFYKEVERRQETVDSNAAVIMPATSIVDPTSNALKPHVSATAAKMSRTKEKQLEKYIQKKLKKDERSILYERLQKSSLDFKPCLTATKTLSQAAKDPKTDRREEHERLSDVSSASSDSSSSSDEEVIRSSEVHMGKNPFAVTGELQHPGLESSESESSDESDQEQAALPSAAFASDSKAFFVDVERSLEVQEARAQLPIYAEEQTIMEAIRAHPVTIVCGETGSGKTTQVPQFLYEAGFGSPSSPNSGLIAITQPRRVAAISMAKRVGFELGNPALAAYQIRYDSSTLTKDTAIKFMTDGILLREIQADFLLAKYSVILLDEAHERNMNTDILVGLLSRIVRLRWKKASEGSSTIKPLRLVVMSATLNISDFVQPHLFSPPPPIIRVEARQHPVTVHFSRKTSPDYVAEAARIVGKIHANLPEGGILVFLSGTREIRTLVKQLRSKYPLSSLESSSECAEEAEGPQEADFASEDEPEALSSSDKEPSDSEDSEVSEDEDGFALNATTKQPLYVLPLYSLLAPEEQMKIFQDPPPGARLCVVATNVAETSITIKNTRYVVDSGKVKQRSWDAYGRQSYEVAWTSKASAAQRTGRAGRTGPGHVYRLFSSAVFQHDFPEHCAPEIARCPIDSLVLQLKSMNIDRVQNFPLPTKPDIERIEQAQRQLIKLGALSASSPSLPITSFGLQMARFPLPSHWAAFLVHAVELAKSQKEARSFLPAALLFASIMAVGDPFVLNGNSNSNANGNGNESASAPSEGTADLKTNLRAFAGRPIVSDLFPALGAFMTFISTPARDRAAWAQCNGLVEKRLEEARQQLHQLVVLLSDLLPSGWQPESMSRLRPEDKTFLQRLMARAIPHQIAERVTVSTSEFKLAAKLPTYRVLGSGMVSENVRYLHPTSLLLKIPPQYLIFTESISVADTRGEQTRHYLKNCTVIESAWIPSAALCRNI